VVLKEQEKSITVSQLVIHKPLSVCGLIYDNLKVLMCFIYIYVTIDGKII